MSCLTDDDLAMLFDGRAGPSARGHAMQHLDECRACWDLMVAAIHGTDQPAANGDADPIVPILAARATIDRYVVDELIGAGGMGVVYRAFDPSLQRQVALKLLHPRLDQTDTSHGARLLDEARVLARLAHPNVIAIHDVGVHAGQIFLATDLGRETLGAWLRAGPRRVAETLRFLRQAGEGLAAAHASGLVHRDIKPENVLIGFDGRALITDFGLARSDHPPAITHELALDEPTLTGTGVVIGTPAYMAPEQLDGRAGDERSDQFAFCVMLFEALSGERPFVATSIAELHRAIAGGRIRRAAARRLPRWLRHAVLRGLHRDPDRRWPSLRALLDELGRGPLLSRTRVVVSAIAGTSLAIVMAALVWGVIATGRERQRADRRFNDVRKLAVSFLFEFHAAIRDLPGSTTARELVVQRAVEQLDSLAREAEHDVDLQQDLATAYETLSELQSSANSSLGNGAASLASRQKAVAIREAVVAQRPGDPRAAAALASALQGAAEALPPAQAVIELRRAVATLANLARASPADPDLQSKLALSHFILATTLATQGDYQVALAEHRTARSIYERLAALEPTSPNLKRSVALGHKYIGALMEKLGDDDGARACYEQAIASDEARLALQPVHADAKLDLSYSLASLAANRREAGDFETSLTLYRKALALREDVAAADPANATAHQVAERGRISIAEVLLRSGDPAGAIDPARSAIDRLETLARSKPSAAIDSSVARAQSVLGAAERALAEHAQTPATRRNEHWRAARAWYRHSLDRLNALADPSALDNELIAKVTAELAACDLALASPTGAP